MHGTMFPKFCIFAEDKVAKLFVRSIHTTVENIKVMVYAG
jgi:hypothetical protein